MQTSVTCAIRLYDDFTGKLLKGPQYQFLVNGLKYKPICKPDGYFVLTNRVEPLILVEVQAAYYKTAHLTIDISTLNKFLPVYDIRLLPTLKATSNITKRLKGNIKTPDTWVMAVPELEKPILKYGGTEKKNNTCWMVINAMSYQSLSGYLFTIKNNQSGPLELFVIKDKQGHNLYEISEQLQKEYKINQEVVRVYRTLSEEDGSFDIPLDDFYDSTAYMLVYSKKKKWIHEIITL